jgi:predicted NBD/HSP70 family sugar kinase
MLQEVNRKIEEGYFSKIIKPGTRTLLWNQLVEAAGNGDSLCRDTLLQGAEFLGHAVAFLINTINPEAIILGKSFIQYAHIVMETLVRTAREKALKYPGSGVKILTSDFGMNSSALGAAMIPIRRVFGKQ